jgi:hypothetical protein
MAAIPRSTTELKKLIDDYASILTNISHHDLARSRISILNRFWRDASSLTGFMHAISPVNLELSQWI